MARYCCDNVVRGYKGDDLDDDGTDFHQHHRQWLEMLGNNYRINFRGLEDHENHEKFYAYGIAITVSELARDHRCAELIFKHHVLYDLSSANIKFKVTYEDLPRV